MIKEAYRIMESTPSDIHPRNMLSDFTPLTKGQYPVFNQYPEFIVEYQNQEREKIRLQEMEHLCERFVGVEKLLATVTAVHLVIWLKSCIYLIRREVSAQHMDFVRRKAEDEIFYAQQVGYVFLIVNNHSCVCSLQYRHKYVKFIPRIYYRKKRNTAGIF